MSARLAVVLVIFGAAAAAAAASARADDNDLVLSRLATSTGNGVIPQNQSFRSLMSELGVVVAPKFLSPADTLGFSGFQLATEFGFTSINSSAPYWCATEESSSCATGFSKSGTIPTFGVVARKGIWLPAPSFEMGAGAVHVGSSRLWAGQLFLKAALQEGFHEWPVPSVAVRGAVSRLFGSEQLDLTVASFDVSISKRFAVFGTYSITPYAGWNHLWIIPRSQVIDETPNVSSVGNPSDVNNNFVFPDESSISRNRWFIGFKLKYYLFAFTAEADFASSGSSTYAPGSMTTPCDSATADQQGSCVAADKSGSQTTLAFSASFDF